MAVRKEIETICNEIEPFNKLTYKTGKELSNMNSISQLKHHLENYQKELIKFIDLIEKSKPFK